MTCNADSNQYGEKFKRMQIYRATYIAIIEVALLRTRSQLVAREGNQFDFPYINKISQMRTTTKSDPL